MFLLLLFFCKSLFWGEKIPDANLESKSCVGKNWGFCVCFFFV